MTPATATRSPSRCPTAPPEFRRLGVVSRRLRPEIIGISRGGKDTCQQVGNFAEYDGYNNRIVMYGLPETGAEVPLVLEDGGEPPEGVWAEADVATVGHSTEASGGELSFTVDAFSATGGLMQISGFGPEYTDGTVGELGEFIACYCPSGEDPDAGPQVADVVSSPCIVRRRVGLAGLLGPRAVRAAPFGAAPDATAAGLLLGDGVRAEQVLEIFLHGGLSPWETFYTVPDYGRPDDPSYPSEQSHLFEGSIAAMAERCDLDPAWLEPEPFAPDADGVMVHLGPLVGPLRNRPDILARMRIVVHHHTLEPHEAAVPLMLTGLRLGNPRMAGGAAAIQRYFTGIDGRPTPRAFTLYPESQIETANLRSASAVGLHPGSARPLELRVGTNIDIPEMMSRTVGADQQAAIDALVRRYSNRASTRYGHLRAPALRDHGAATGLFEEMDALALLLTEEAMQARTGLSCGLEDYSQPATALQIARHLLTHPTDPARAVTVIDEGLRPASGGGGYDVHTNHIGDTATNLTHTLHTLCDIVAEPGDDDPSKVDLDHTMVALTTEFGRTPSGSAARATAPITIPTATCRC